MKNFISTLLCAATVLMNNAIADQVCVDSINRSTPDGRFAILEEGRAVLDRITNLTWARCPLGYAFSGSGTPEQYADDRCLPDGSATMNWQEALQAVDALNQNTAAPLRLPNVKELSSLVESSCGWPAISTYAFPDTPAEDFWSSTPNGPTGARMVSFDSGLVTSAGRAVAKRVRFVSGGDIT